MTWQASHQTGQFSEREAALVADALNGIAVSFDPHVELVMTVDDAIRLDALDQKWGVDGEALVHRLRRLSLDTVISVFDAASAFWSYHHRLSLAAALRESGLTSLVLDRDSGTAQPPLPEPFESMNCVDRLVEAECLTPQALVRFLAHPERRVRDYARQKLPDVS